MHIHFRRHWQLRQRLGRRWWYVQAHLPHGSLGAPDAGMKHALAKRPFALPCDKLVALKAVLQRHAAVRTCSACTRVVRRAACAIHGLGRQRQLVCGPPLAAEVGRRPLHTKRSLVCRFAHLPLVRRQLRGAARLPHQRCARRPHRVLHRRGATARPAAAVVAKPLACAGVRNARLGSNLSGWSP